MYTECDLHRHDYSVDDSKKLIIFHLCKYIKIPTSVIAEVNETKNFVKFEYKLQVPAFLNYKALMTNKMFQPLESVIILSSVQ